MRLIAAVILLLSAAGIAKTDAAGVSAGSPAIDPNNPRQLEDYLYLAALNNAGLKSSYERFRAAGAMIDQAKALDDPQLTFGYFVRDQMEDGRSLHEQDYRIMQMFPWFGKLEARTDAASAQAWAAFHRYQAAKVKLIYQVSSVFYEFAYLAQAVEIARDNLELMKHFEQVAREKYRTAEGTHPDIVRAQIELATMEDDLITMTRMRKPVAAQLNAVLNQPTDRELQWPAQEKVVFAEIVPDAIIQQIHSSNPELAAMQQQILASRKMMTLAKKRYWPDISLGVEYQNMPNRGDDEQNPVIAMISINLPIWVDSYSAGFRQAAAETAMARREKMQTEFDLAAQAQQVLFDIDDSGRKIRLYEDVLIPKAKEMIDVSEQAYRTNTIDFLSLLDAQKKLLEFQLRHQRAAANYLQKRAELEMLIGKPITTKEQAK